MMRMSHERVVNHRCTAPHQEIEVGEGRHRQEENPQLQVGWLVLRLEYESRFQSGQETAADCKIYRFVRHLGNQWEIDQETRDQATVDGYINYDPRQDHGKQVRSGQEIQVVAKAVGCIRHPDGVLGLTARGHIRHHWMIEPCGVDAT
jgi:hypothetical protein